MVKDIPSRHRRRRREPLVNTMPLRSHRHAGRPADPAQRDLLAAILDAAEDHDDARQLPKITAHLAEYSNCRCVGIVLFEGESVASCTWYHGRAGGFQRTSRDSFPKSETCICNAMVITAPNSRRPCLADHGAFLRNSRPDASTRTETPHDPSGICMGSSFESVALIPIRHHETIMGFMFIADERKDRISRGKASFMGRVGTYIGGVFQRLEALDKPRQLEHGSTSAADKAATAPREPDEMKLVTRLIENANESIVISQDWRIIYVNSKCAEMAGLPKQDMIGIAFLDIIHPDDRSAAVERYSRILNGEWFSSGTVFRGFDNHGNTRWVELREVPFSWNGRPAVMHLVNDITDRMRFDKALALSERKYRQLVETLNEGVWAIDKDANIAFVNPRMAEILGYTVEEMVGRPLLSFVTLVTDESGAEIAGRRLENRRQGNREVYAAQATRKDGATIHLSVCASPIVDDDGKYAGAIAAVQDITEQKKAEQALRDSERHYRFLADNTTDVIWTADLNLKPTYFSPSVHNLLGYTIDEAMSGTLETRFTPASARVASEAFAGATARDEQRPGSAKLQTLELELIRKDGSAVWVETTAIFMRDSNDQPIGILGAMRDITERRRAKETLRVSEERYRLLVETANEAIVVIQDGVLKFVSPNIEQISGYKASEVALRSFADFIHPDDIQMVAEHYTRRLSGEDPSQTYQFRFNDKAGNTKWAQVNAVLFDWEGKTATLALISDITEWKMANEALRASEERFRTLIENARDAVTVTDESFRVVYESPSLATVTGYPPEEWVGKSMADMEVHPDDMPLLLSKLDHLKNRPGLLTKDIAVRYRHRDGSWHVVEASGRNLLQDPRVKGLVFNFRDITARRQIEEALEESERRYRLLAENASDVIFTSDLALKLTYVSPSVVQLSGFTPEEVASLSIDEWLAPGSKEYVLSALPWGLSQARSGIDLPPASRTGNVELMRKDGGTVWAEVRIAFLRDATDQVTGLIGVARDITDRRMAEVERDRRVQLELLVTEISTAFISIPTEDMDAGIHNALASISWFTEADRSHIFMFSEDRTSMRLAHEWCSESTDPPTGRLDSVQVDSIPWLMARVKKAQCAHIPEVADLPATAEGEKALFRSQGVQSVVVVPMVQAGNAIGFLGLGSTDGGKTWDNETIAALRLVAEMFSNALERKRMDLALRESEKRYRLLAENITDVIWTADMEAKITYMSPSATRLTGYATEELGKLTVADLLTPDSFERGMKTMAEQQSLWGVQPESQPHYWTLEVELRRKDGSTLWAEEQVTFIRDARGTAVGLLGVTRDISQRKSMQDALRISEERYRTLVEASPDGVMSIDRHGIIIDCNPGLCRMLGYDRDSLRGQQARHLMAPEDLAAEPEYRSHLNKGEVMEVETEIIRRDGQPLPVWAKMVQLAKAGAADMRTIVYFRDIADRRKIDEMKDEFISLVSHELRSPLTVIIGALHTAISEAPRLSQKETHQLLQDAAIEAEQLSHLVGNLLELSRAQANRLVLHVEPINLAKAVHKVIGAIERQSSKHRFTVDLPRKLPPVTADQLRLERILYNLLENAVKCSPEGSDIEVSAKREGGHLVVSVSDHGPGISKEDQSKLFKPFQQLGDPVLDHTKGAGLGLLVCRRLVEAHGGRIWVESEPGHGAAFRFTLEASTMNGPSSE